MNAPSAYKWRTVDILVAAVLAVAFGVVFQLANGLWDVLGKVFVFFPPALAVIYGLWLVPAVLASLIIRKAGAGLFTETVAAAVSVLMGSPYGAMGIAQGAFEGLGAEVVFAAGAWRRYGALMALASGALGGAAATGWDVFVSYPMWTLAWKLSYIGCGAASCAVIAGLGSVLLTKALAGTGVLDSFPSGRKRTTV
ncbi:ECF transporter S component [Stackebrandtia nassauensis]|uniref:Membrane protein-like protein n=1 Tax=Stackebrandtia nassauensis (strain DSM 44728 / CIP 108903 / NRRL B-16338 / NBRC 102104 / LLR-40K-21) TaxID=446470 RepID=D3Q0K5_STANL|nr:ECF transporter S component [Stackebrandtia nassauensis]ADD41741.1 membrane protein-like protein [Stackebrandtia nassauensis DSM 44728]